MNTQQPRLRTPEEDKWTRIASEDYDDAVYNNPLLSDVYYHELDYMATSTHRDHVLVEVGCGTCKFCMSFIGDFQYVVGVDISNKFLDHVRDKYLTTNNKLFLVNGDATHLRAVLRSTKELPPDFWSRKRLVCCVMNTLGIMPQSIRQSVINEMLKLAGDDGQFFLVVFNGEKFTKGINEFYRTVPHLCGSVRDTDYDLDTRELRVAATGYYSHWFMYDEIVSMLETAGVRDYHIERHGIGLFVTRPLINSVFPSDDDLGRAAL